jgi:hypothetical protein
MQIYLAPSDEEERWKNYQVVSAKLPTKLPNGHVATYST